MKTFSSILFAYAIILLGCQSQAQAEESTSSTESNGQDSIHQVEDSLKESPDEIVEELVRDTFSRDRIREKLQAKIDQNETLIVHCLVPLCDNKHQGIVPTSESLGNGFSTRTNLYWATSHGQKKYFARHAKWSQIDVGFTATDTVLERVAFERKFENGAKVILVCDAYRGDMMEPCVYDYLNYLAGHKQDSLLLGSSVLPIGSEADMMVFNGHNGMMDFYPDSVYATEVREKDAVVIACSSEAYFTPHYVQTNSYPLVNTTNLLYPGAFCMNGVIEKWAMMDTEENIRLAAGDAYNEVKKCGQRGARNLFSTGWEYWEP